MRNFIKQFSSDYSMMLVLLGLCIFFSVVTVSEQSPSSDVAAQQVATQISNLQGKTSLRVLIAAADQPQDVQFATKLETLILNNHLHSTTTISMGEPKDARAALEKLQQTSNGLDVVACSKIASDWLVFADLNNDFPTLGSPVIVAPRSYRWPNFLKSENLLNIANQIAVIAIIAIGMTLVIITGGIDLSVGSLLALSSVLAARWIRDYAGGVQASWLGMITVSFLAIAACGLIGAFSGWMITRFKIPPFIVTLTMMLVGSGLAYTLAEGQSIYQMPDSATWLGRGADFWGLPNAVLLMIVLYLIAHIFMSRMTFGRYLYSVGGNSEAARLSGVPVNRIVMIAYIVCAMLAGLGGVIMASQLKSGSATYGNMYELYVIAAVVVGGASLSGGEGRMTGTLLGAFTIAVIQNGMNLTNIESYTQKIVLGAVILGAVLLDKIKKSS